MNHKNQVKQTTDHVDVSI